MQATALLHHNNQHRLPLKSGALAPGDREQQQAIG